MHYMFDRSGQLPGTEEMVLDWIEALGDLSEFDFTSGAAEGQTTLFDALEAMCCHHLHNLGVHVYRINGGPRAA